MLQRKVLTLVFVRRPAAQDAAGAAGSVLLGWKKRGFGAFRYNGFGGKVEPGETVAAAAARELLEVWRHHLPRSLWKKHTQIERDNMNRHNGSEGAL